MAEEKSKTIVVKETTWKDLEDRKIHPNQSFDEVIVEILKLTHKKR